MSYYMTGTITVTGASAAVTGSGTSFSANVKVGDVLIKDGLSGVIKEVTNNTTLVLEKLWEGSTEAGATDWVIIHTGSDWNTVVAVHEDIIELLDELATRFLEATATLDFPSIAAAGTQSLTIAVAGAVVGDPVALGLPAAPAAGVIFTGHVSATDTVTVRAMNITGSAVDPASASYTAKVFK